MKGERDPPPLKGSYKGAEGSPEKYNRVNDQKGLFRAVDSVIVPEIHTVKKKCIIKDWRDKNKLAVSWLVVSFTLLIKKTSSAFL